MERARSRSASRVRDALRRGALANPPAARLARAQVVHPLDAGHRLVRRAGAGGVRHRSPQRVRGAADDCRGALALGGSARPDRGAAIPGTGRRGRGGARIRRPLRAPMLQTRRTALLALAFAIVSAVVRGARVWAWISIGVAWVRDRDRRRQFSICDWEPGRIALTTLGILFVFGVGEGHAESPRSSAEFRRRLQGERRQSAVQAGARAHRPRTARRARALAQPDQRAGRRRVASHELAAREGRGGPREHQGDQQVGARRGALGARGAARGGSGCGGPLVPEPGLDRLPASRVTVSTSPLKVTLDDHLDHADVPAPVQLALYRIVQESLTNIGRHADGARTATVSLRLDEGVYRVEVRDDGTRVESHGE